MSWRKFFKPVNGVLPVQRSSGNNMPSSMSKYTSWLPEVYTGPADRMARYAQYEMMDMDHEISAALDTIAEFSTQRDNFSKLPFSMHFKNSPTPTEVKILEKYLQNWCSLNDFNRRLFKMFRSTLMYGDQMFIRDPETFKLFWVDPNNVEKIIVNESRGKDVEEYYIKNVDLNLKEMVASNLSCGPQLNLMPSGLTYTQPQIRQTNRLNAMAGNPSQAESMPVSAQHVFHLSLTEGLDAAWPFGISILEKIYKVYKQKELLEDAMLIYRIHRAPERRIFYVDVGTMPPTKAQQYIEKIKFEVQQRRMPNRTSSGQNIMDTGYNALSTIEDYYFAQSSDGRGSKVDVLPGGCLSMDTKVSLLDGRELSITEIEEELKTKQLWTYSCHPTTGAVVPGLISWAGVTQKSVQVMKITLDNGKDLVCTLDHKFPIHGVGFVEAKDLIVNQSMIPFHNKGILINEIEYLDEKIEVGTLTIDSKEEYHNYHTFALSCGIFTKNSNLGEINDLLYFNNKMMRGLGIPSSYLPTGPTDGTASMNDGKVGTAFIQEFRFSEKCKRYQTQLARLFDNEFKLFLKNRGVTIDNSLFEIEFVVPQNFARYRELEMYAAQSSIFAAIADIPYMSKRFALKKYLGLTEEELIVNERMYMEEQSGASVGEHMSSPEAGLRQVGISSSDMAPDIGGEEITFDDNENAPEETEDNISNDEIDSFGEE